MREIQVVEKCDICKEAKPLHWDSMSVSISGVDYLVDVCEFDATESERTLARFFDLIEQNSRVAEEEIKPRKNQPKRGQSPLVDRPHCGRQFRKSGLTLHVSRKHAHSDRDD